MPHKLVETSKTGIQGRPHDEHEHLKIQRLNESVPSDKSHYLLAAFAEFNAGEPIPAQYPGPAVGYVIDGEVHLTDESKPGEVTKLFAGDVIHVEYDSRMIISSPNKAKCFAVSYAPSHIHPEDYVVSKK